MIQESSSNYLESFGGSEVQHNWLGETWTRPKIRNHSNDGSSGSPKWNLKVTSPKWSRIMLRSFRPLFSQHLQSKLPPRPPQTPTPDSSWFSPILYSKYIHRLTDSLKNVVASPFMGGVAMAAVPWRRHHAISYRNQQGPFSEINTVLARRKGETLTYHSALTIGSFIALLGLLKTCIG